MSEVAIDDFIVLLLGICVVKMEDYMTCLVCFLAGSILYQSAASLYIN